MLHQCHGRPAKRRSRGECATQLTRVNRIGPVRQPVRRKATSPDGPIDRGLGDTDRACCTTECVHDRKVCMETSQPQCLHTR